MNALTGAAIGGMLTWMAMSVRRARANRKRAGQRVIRDVRAQLLGLGTLDA